MFKNRKVSGPTILALSLFLAFALAPRLALAVGYANPELVIETDQLDKMSNQANVRIIDVRPNAAYRKGHIPNAQHLGADDIIDPNSRIEAALLPEAKLAAMLGERGIGKDTKVILYDDRGGFHAARVFWMLEYFGHRDVAILNGGFPKWEKEGRKVTTLVPRAKVAKFPIDVTERRIATADWVLERKDDSNVVVVDVRPPKVYEQGHIPWARSIPWSQNLTSESTLKSADELTKHFESNGVKKENNVVVHCQQGKAAGHSYYALRVLGYPRVRSYDRSWAEWGADEALPKAGQVAMAPKATTANPCGAAPSNPCAIDTLKRTLQKGLESLGK
ncbi:MAG: sulfurtransferase [Deltaproteobacteria bacterium]|nr:sulfurtransferase [Deltaproteobacteria bacterium]